MKILLQQTLLNLPLKFAKFFSGAFIAIFFTASVMAGDVADTPTDILTLKKEASYSEGGADSCLNCHDSESDYPATRIFSTSHTVKADKNAPFGESRLQCESCHGPGGEHVVRRVKEGEVREPVISFSQKNIAIAELNTICSSCHQSVEKQHWQGGAHQLADVACSDCHKIHQTHDPVKQKHQQVQVCGQCHQEQKLTVHRFSSHPLDAQGQMGCTDCHSPHGSINENLLIGNSTNDTCYNCHAEKRGPFVWEHQPVTEDCAACHASHGSNQKAMLKRRAPLLCQSCHSSEGHPSVAYTSPNATQQAASMLLGRSCTNCHAQVHGSNHPSGALLQR